MPDSEHEDLEKQLEQLGADVLAGFVARLADGDRVIDERVEALLLRADPVRLGKALRKRLGAIIRGRRYISYKESFEFAAKLDRFLEDLEEGLLTALPELAVELSEKFIKADQRIVNRVDDSGGSMGLVFSRACGLWARAMALLPPALDRVDRLYDLHADNDYGVRDKLLDESAVMLEELELRRLARRYEDDVKAAIATQDAEQSRFDEYSARAAMGQVACALEDAALYERSVLMLSSEPNYLQRENIARNYIRFGPASRAVHWLEGRDNENLYLLADALEQLGDPDRLRDVRKRLFAQTLEPEHLAAYLELLPETERDTARRNAASEAARSRDLARAVRLLFALGEAERAEALIVERSDELQDVFYSTLRDLAESAAEAERPLAATVCFRALVTQILGEGRSKAYRHARRYCVQLQTLDSGIEDRRGLAGHDRYMATLREAHGRKWSFWKLLEEEKS